MLGLAGRALIEVLGRILSVHRPDLEYQAPAAGPDPCDRPPPEKCPNPDTVQLGYPALHDPSADPLGIGGEVVVRRESDPACAY